MRTELLKRLHEVLEECENEQLIINCKRDLHIAEILQLDFEDVLKLCIYKMEIDIRNAKHEIISVQSVENVLNDYINNLKKVNEPEVAEEVQKIVNDIEDEGKFERAVDYCYTIFSYIIDNAIGYESAYSDEKLSEMGFSKDEIHVIQWLQKR